MLTRREILFAATAAASLNVTSSLKCLAEETPPQAEKPFPLSLNTGTLIGYDLDVEQEVDIAAEAGYAGVELWMMRIQRFLEKGGKLPELRRRIEDHGLTLVGGVGFASWLVDDDARRAEGIAQMTKEMDILAELGCRHIAAPAAGLTEPITDLDEAGERYRAILEIGRKTGVRPLLELWGWSPAMSKMSVAAAVATAAGDEDAALLLDVFHIFKGGNRFESLGLLNGRKMPVLHLNDYPADPPLEKITDADRVYPGDGIAPLATILQTMRDTGFTGFLSLEVFNRTYWETQSPLEAAKMGKEKMERVMEL